jgi:hypothetical protein
MPWMPWTLAPEHLGAAILLAYTARSQPTWGAGSPRGNHWLGAGTSATAASSQ